MPERYFPPAPFDSKALPALALSLTLALLTACSGGGDGATVPAPAPAPTPAPAPPPATAPTMVVAPASTSVTAGSDASFSVTASGTNLAYQWQTSPDGTVWTDAAGATSASFTLSAVTLTANGRHVRVQVSNSAGAVTSGDAVLTVTPLAVAPTLLTQPASASVVAPAGAVFSAAASATPAPTFQWQLSTNNGVSYSDIAGATAFQHATAATSLVDSGKLYRVKVSNGTASVFSNAAALTVAAATAVATGLTVNPAVARPGQTVDVAITLANTGSTAQSASITLPVPSYTQAAGSQGVLSCSSGSFPCVPGQQLSFGVILAAGQSVTRVFSLAVPAAGAPADGTAVALNATASTGAFAPANAGFTIASAAQPQVSLRSLASSTAGGKTLRYTVDFGNPGSSAVDADLTLALPAGTTLLGASDAGQASAGVLRWSLGTLRAGIHGQRQFTLSVDSPRTAGGIVNATAQLVAPATQLRVADSSQALAVVPDAVQLTLSPPAGPLRAGQTGWFELTAFNTSGTSQSGSASFTVPPGATVERNAGVLLSCSTGSFPCLPGQAVSFGYLLTAGQSLTRSVGVTLSAATPLAAGSLLNVSAALSNSGSSTTASVPVAGAAGLQLAIDAASGTATPGGSVSVTLTASNAGSSAATADLLLPLPTGATVVSAGGGAAGNGALRFSLGSLAAGASTTRQVSLQLPAPLAALPEGPLLQMAARLVDPATALSLAQAETTVAVSAAPVQWQASWSAASVAPGLVVNLSTSVSNTGSATVSGTGYILLPAGTSVASQAGLSCSTLSFPCTAGQVLNYGYIVTAGQTLNKVIAVGMPTAGAPATGTLLSALVHDSSTGVSPASATVVVKP